MAPRVEVSPVTVTAGSLISMHAPASSGDGVRKPKVLPESSDGSHT